MVGGIMSDVFYEMSKVTIKPVVNYTVLQIFLISSLNFNLVVAFCTVAGNISHTFTPHTLGLFKCIVYLQVFSSFLKFNLFITMQIHRRSNKIYHTCSFTLSEFQDISDTGVVYHIFHIEDLHQPFFDKCFQCILEPSLVVFPF